MTPGMQAVLAELRRDGPRRFAGWDAALFDAVTAGPAAALAEGLGGQADAEAVVTGYLRLVQQGVGGGAVRQAAAGAGGWTSFLERLLVESVPRLLPGVRAGRRAELLVDVWNLGEGLLREPAWLDRYVTASAGGLTAVDGLEKFLARTLTPVLTPAPPAAWAGELRVSVVDLRAAHDEFLPGRLRLAAPTVVCVEDRRRAGLQIGVLLRRGKSEPLGVVAGLGEYPEAGAGPRVEFADGRATVGGRTVAVPTLRRCYGYAVARAGFVAACAADSQRLWVIESD